MDTVIDAPATAALQVTMLVAEHANGERYAIGYDLAPDDGVKRPWLTTETNIAPFEDEWARGDPVLTFRPDPANGGAAPRRITPPGAVPSAQRHYDPPVRLR